VIASNTSAIAIGRLSAHLAHPQRFLGTHWFNPPLWVPCVEVIAGPDTEPTVIERTLTLLHQLGKQPVQVGDAAGFVANRIQFAMFREASAVVEEGLASAAEVDAVVRGSFGFRLPFFGPFEIADMAGLDVYAGAYAALEHEFGSRLGAPPSLQRMVAAGRLGAKTLRGYREHTPAEVERAAAHRDVAFHGLAKMLAAVEREQASERSRVQRPGNRPSAVT
jgi:3-hydroxybutyryl-CoA dehydrogenase